MEKEQIEIEKVKKQLHLLNKEKERIDEERDACLNTLDILYESDELQAAISFVGNYYVYPDENGSKFYYHISNVDEKRKIVKVIKISIMLDDPSDMYPSLEAYFYEDTFENVLQFNEYQKCTKREFDKAVSKVYSEFDKLYATRNVLTEKNY